MSRTPFIYFCLLVFYIWIPGTTNVNNNNNNDYDYNVPIRNVLCRCSKQSYFEQSYFELLKLQMTDANTGTCNLIINIFLIFVKCISHTIVTYGFNRRLRGRGKGGGGGTNKGKKRKKVGHTFPCPSPTSSPPDPTALIKNRLICVKSVQINEVWRGGSYYR